MKLNSEFQISTNIRDSNFEIDFYKMNKIFVNNLVSQYKKLNE